jgi:hypothetical protein
VTPKYIFVLYFSVHQNTLSIIWHSQKKKFVMFAYMCSNSHKLDYYGAASLMFKLLDEQFLLHLLWGSVNVEGVAWGISLTSTGEFGVGAGLSEVAADGVIINYFYKAVSKN